MRIEQEKLLELESEYQVSFSTIMYYYTVLLETPCVQRNGDELLVDCLETLIQSRISAEFKQKQYENQGEYMSFEYSLSDALYRVYDEEAIPYLCEEYKEEKGLGTLDL